MCRSAVAIILASIAGAPASAGAAAVEPAAGIWMTDEGDGVVEIRSCGEELCGYVYAVLRVPHPDRPLVDARNEDPQLRVRPLCGLQVIGGLRRLSPQSWGDGWVYDPKVGKTYRVELSLQGSAALSVHGYLGTKLFGRTVAWTRAATGLRKCSPPA
jgi:uncharacterized protein (DUF2147 family)